MSNEIKDMIVDKGVEKGAEKVINLTNEAIKGVIVGNEEHKKMIKNRDEEQKQLDEEKKKALKDLNDLYEMKKENPEIDLSKKISDANEYYKHKKQVYDDHVEETKNLNDKESSDPERKSRDTILSGTLCGALGGLLYGVTTHYLKDNAKNLKIK